MSFRRMHIDKAARNARSDAWYSATYLNVGCKNGSSSNKGKKMPFFILSLIVQAALVIHILKTGRNTIWIWVVVLLPGAGSVAYFALEVIPELMGSRTARRASRGVEQIINPNKSINAAAQSYALSDTVENSLNLAEECLSKGMYAEAKGFMKKPFSVSTKMIQILCFALQRQSSR